MPARDILDDLNAHILHLVGEGVPIAQACARAEEAVRQVWGGDRPYIKKGAGDETLSDRDRVIVNEYRRGERIDLLARRHGVSVRRVQQIIKESEKN